MLAGFGKWKHGSGGLYHRNHRAWRGVITYRLGDLLDRGRHHI